MLAFPDEFPEEIILYLLSFLDGESLVSIYYVNKQFNILVNSLLTNLSAPPNTLVEMALANQHFQNILFNALKQNEATKSNEPIKPNPLTPEKLLAIKSNLIQSIKLEIKNAETALTKFSLLPQNFKLLESKLNSKNLYTLFPFQNSFNLDNTEEFLREKATIICWAIIYFILIGVSFGTITATCDSRVIADDIAFELDNDTQALAKKTLDTALCTTAIPTGAAAATALFLGLWFIMRCMSCLICDLPKLPTNYQERADFKTAIKNILTQIKDFLATEGLTFHAAVTKFQTIYRHYEKLHALLIEIIKIKNPKSISKEQAEEITPLDNIVTQSISNRSPKFDNFSKSIKTLEEFTDKFQALITEAEKFVGIAHSQEERVVEIKEENETTSSQRPLMLNS